MTWPLLFLACAGKDDGFSGSGDDSGESDSDSDADADSDSDSDSDTDTDAGGPLATFDYDALSDVVAYDSSTTLLATNRSQASLDVIDMTTGNASSRIVLGDTPMRVAWDSTTGLAYVVHGDHGYADESGGACKDDVTCVHRLDVVDVLNETYSSIDLVVGDTAYEGTDVVLKGDGGLYVLADGDDWWSEEAVLEIDAAGGIAAVWMLEERYEVNAIPLGFDGTSIYAEHWRFEFDPKKDEKGRRWLREAANYAPTDYDDWNGRPVHTAITSDGTGILFPGDSMGGSPTVVELDPGADSIVRTFVLDEDISYGADDMAYTQDDARVVTFGFDYDRVQLQVFDRGSGAEQAALDLGPDDGTISYDEAMLVLSPNDAYAWVYLYGDSWNDGRGRFLALSL